MIVYRRRIPSLVDGDENSSQEKPLLQSLVKLLLVDEIGPSVAMEKAESWAARENLGVFSVTSCPDTSCPDRRSQGQVPSTTSEEAEEDTVSDSATRGAKESGVRQCTTATAGGSRETAASSCGTPQSLGD
jgi:hypothetical protein